MKSRAKRWRLAIPLIAAIAVTLSIALAPGLAGAKDATDSQATSPSLAAGEVYETPEWAIDDNPDAQQGGLEAQAAPPGAYDLRNEGLVTPVKMQNPWGSCWAFGGTAAAEVSILSAYGSTYEQSKLDLSERHLTYFALMPVTENIDPAQVGEGMHTIDTSANAPFNAGGIPVFITTLFSQGIGPVQESLFPYRGVGEDGKSHTYYEYWQAHPYEVTKAELEKMFGKGNVTDAQVEYYKEAIGNALKESPTYSDQDDWSIPAMNENGTSNRLISNGVVLKNGNTLPEYWNADKTAVEGASRDAIKQELLNGRGVSIKYTADQSGAYTNEVPGATGQSTTFNQYTPTALRPNHGICIVGWDDNYSAENFKETAPGNGAWIAKNSWGSETDAMEDDLRTLINKGTFGSKNDEGKATGFFYLSYYDKTICQPESMEFTSNLGTSGSFYAIQHDYMPAYSNFYKTPASSDVVSSANVFEAQDGIDIKSISTRTSEANTRVTFAIYEMSDNAQNPTDGTMLYRTSQNFQYGGFHRLDLERPVSIAKGKKYSVVSTASTIDADGKRSYNAAANMGLSKKAADQYIAQGTQLKSYSSSVVNKGESYLYDGKTWVDWADYISKLPVDPVIQEGLQGDSFVDLNPIDNFSIKVYAEKTPVVEAAWVRLGGETAYGTMVKAVNEGWDTADTVVIATFNGYWDALAASALAGSENAPVLLTDPRTLSPETGELIKSLGAKKAYICGGTAAVGEGVAKAIEELGLEVERFGGTMAFNTAELISAKAKATLGDACNTCVIATTDGFYDSLSVAPAAYNLGMPIYLTGPDKTLAASTTQAIKDAGYTKAVIVGGTSAVKAEVEDQLTQAGVGEVNRLGGENAWQTSQMIAEWGIDNGLNATTVGVADGNGYWDALTGAPLIGSMGGTLVLVPHNGPTFDESGTMAYDPYCIEHFVTSNASAIKHGYAFGGSAAVSETAFNACVEITHRATR